MPPTESSLHADGDHDFVELNGRCLVCGALVEKNTGAIDWQPTLESIGQRVAAQRQRGFEDTSAQASVDRRVLWDDTRALVDTLEEALRLRS